MAAGKVNVSRRVCGVEYNSGAKDSRIIPCKGKLGVGSEYEITRRFVDGGIGVSSPEKKRKIYSFSEESLSSDEHEPGQLDEEDFSNAPNILTSRWAYDDHHDEDIPKEKVGAFAKPEGLKRRRSSPESGLTQKEESDGSGNRISDSDGGYVLQYFTGEVSSKSDTDEEACTDIDDDCISDQSDMDSSDDSKPGVSGQGRNMLQACRSVYEYERLGKINEGSYGIVYKARDKKTGEMVALKKLKMGDEKEGFPLYYLREINTLMSLNHPSVVNCREVVVDDSVDCFGSIYLAMEYVEHDLKALMQAKKQCFSQSEVKCLMLQLLEAVQYLHDNWVLHRDLKTSNLLLNNKGELKVCDFGMARQYGSPAKPYTALVVTLWYRAPELLLGAKEYSTAVDLWSVGCIMAELLTGKPLFDGKSELEQLNKIFRTLGTPSDKIWPEFSRLPGVKANLVHQSCNVLHTKFPRASFTGSPTLSDLGLDLLSKLLTYDPAKRITAAEAVNHRWFQEVPLPQTKDFMPAFPVGNVTLTR